MALATVIEGPGVGNKLLTTLDGEPAGTLGNDDLDSWGTTWRVGVVVIFVALALLAVWRPEPRMIAVLVWWTVGYWLIRGGGILLDDHSASFKAIHTALMVVSIGAAMWVWKTRSR